MKYGCRCRDIPKCSSDIRRIENISSLFKDSDDINESVSAELNGLAMECFIAFSCKNIQELTTEEKKLNKTLTESLPQLVNKCEYKIEKLRNELRSMRSEDRDYHEEQERRRRHHHHHDDDDDD